MKNVKSILLTLAALLCSTVANAYSFEADGIYYNITSSSALTVGVTYKTSDYNSYSGDVVIPSTVVYNEKTYTVTSIGSDAFKNCSSLTSIIIPEGVTSIGGYAFYNCSSLTSITIPEGVTSIGSGAFSNCSSLTSIIIPESVTSIGESAFYGCSSLTSITIPESVTSIGSGAFRGTAWYNNQPDGVIYAGNVLCGYKGEMLVNTSIEIREGTISISPSAFDGYSSLTSITIPEGVTSIGNAAFRNCSSLTSITIPEGVTSIGDYAFRNCSSLTSITIPRSVRSIGNKAFYGTVWYDNQPDGLVYAGNVLYKYKGEMPVNTSIEIREGTAGISPSAFDDCSSLTSITIPESVTSIGSYAFRNCSSLTSITIPEGVTSIGDYAFYGCSSLTSIIIPEGVTSIGDYAFYGCSSLTSIIIPEGVTSIGSWTFDGCSSLTSIIIPEGVTSIGGYAFRNCSSLTSITIPEGVTSIEYGAFDGCSSLTFITFPEGLTRIGSKAFTNNVIEFVYLNSTTPPALSSSSSLLIADYGVFVVPESAYETYCAADYWKEDALRKKIVTKEAYRQVLTLEAKDDVSALYEAIGEKNLPRVVDLTISGSINSHDFFMMLTKMTALRHLDLTNASIVYNSRCHYGSYHTDDNVFPPYGLYGCKLLSLKLPVGITAIGQQAVARNLIKEIVIPESVTFIGLSAFDRCANLKNVVIPPSVRTIETTAFYETGLEEIRIPGSVRSIGNLAFDECSNLQDIYVYTVEPISIEQGTFNKSGNNFIGTLHAPKVSYSNYYFHTQWGQFLAFEEFDEPYENFYLQGDKELNNSTGVINGTENNNPDADMGNNSGLLTDGDINQELGDVNIEHDGAEGGSIIAGGNSTVSADNLHFRINVTGGRWYFFCFPFDIKAEDIKLENGANWVFRYYDGEERAKNGKGGWKNVTSDGEGNHLKAATGYIFQCSQDDVLVLTAKDKKIKKENKYNELVAHVTENAHDASWNFVGNPYLSYYEVNQDDYSAPITVWDGSKYIAIRPGDDDYQLAPFEAFFVQKPEGKDKVNYDADRQHTYHGAQKAAEQARARRRTQAVNPGRLLVNLTLTDGQATDKTRVVFNNSVSAGYEAACDAAKFSTAGVPQLYTIDSRAVKYAINERPVAEGIVTVGFTAPVQGNYTIAAPRMDTPMLLRDNATGTIHDFSEGSYEFASEAGTFDDRFTLMMKSETTGIDKGQWPNDNESPVYNTKGQRVNEATEQGIYIKGDRKVVKM